VTKIADKSNAILGETITFTVTLNNLTDKPVDSASVGDLLETGFQFVSQEVSLGTYDVQTGIWSLENLPALGTATLEITVEVIEGSNYTNTATLLDSSPFDDNPDNDVSETITIETDVPEGVDLLVEKSVLPNTALLGDEIIFEIKVTNQSIEDVVNNIRIAEILNDTFELVSAVANNGSYDEEVGEWTIPSLALGEEALLTITVIATSIGDFENTASYLGSTPRDSDPSNNTQTVSVEVVEKTPASPGFLYNQFSPNGNNQNEILRLNLVDQETGRTVNIQYNIKIFDRYGNMVHEVEKMNDPDVWDGLWEGKEAPKGTYFYIMVYQIDNNPEVTEKGWIQLLR
jgi:gliding motility-associated-like protein/uncharacterized repeat protein (TIGR01451 family)